MFLIQRTFLHPHVVEINKALACCMDLKDYVIFTIP